MAETVFTIQASEQLAGLSERLAEGGNRQVVAVAQHGKPVLAVLPWELYESLVETVEILGDAEQMAAVRQSMQDLDAGKAIDWEVVKAQLDLA